VTRCVFACALLSLSSTVLGDTIKTNGGLTASNEVIRVEETSCNRLPDAILSPESPKTNSECRVNACADPDLESYLRRQDLRYGYTDDGDVRLTFDLGNGRSQLVLISSKCDNLNGLRMRKVYSPCYRGKVTKPMLRDLLYANYIIGAFHVEESATRGQEVVLFVAQMSWDVMPVDFETILRQVAISADRLEDAWTDADDF